MTASPFFWGAPGVFTLAIAGDGSTPTLKNLASAANKIGNAITPGTTAPLDTGRYRYGLWQLRARFQSAPTAGKFVSLYFVKSADGTNYEDGDDSTAPPLSAWVRNFPVRATTGQQIITLDRIVYPTVPFKPLIVNASGQAMTNTNDENQLHHRPYDVEVGT